MIHHPGKKIAIDSEITINGKLSTEQKRATGSVAADLPVCVQE